MMDKARESFVGKMNIMDVTGHTELKWHMDKLDEIDAVKKTFDRLVAQGYTAFGSDKSTEAKHAVKEFDPTLGEVVMVPRIVGG
jgi:hypothetical protein